jgi:hypothetical protein
MADRQGATRSGAWVSKAGDQIAHPHQEDARVPQVAALGQHRLRGPKVGLLAEAFQRHRRAVLGRAVELQVAISRLGTVRSGAERHESAGSGRFRAAQHGPAKGLDVTDDVIGGRHQNQRLGGVLEHQGRGQDGRRRVTADRLDHHACVPQAQVGGLVGGQEPERVTGHHQGGGETFGGEPRQRHLVERLVRDQGRELLGICLARDGPQTCAGAAAKDDRMDDHDRVFRSGRRAPRPGMSGGLLPASHGLVPPYNRGMTEFRPYFDAG